MLLKFKLITDQTIEIGVGGSLNVKVTTTDVIDGFIVDHKCTVRVLQRCVRGQN
jgi:hypothetical protein